MTFNLFSCSASRKLATAASAITTTLLVSTSAAIATEVTVTIDNLSPDMGLVLTPLWVGFHDGSFDLFEPGVAATEALERIAEDGSPMALREAFAAEGTDGEADWQDGVITGEGVSPESPPLIPPRTSASMTFTLEEGQDFFSYASMILPSNDGFVGNESGTAHRIFDAEGNFIGTEFVIIGAQIKDAGTEVNDEIPENVPLLGQQSPNTGTAEEGLVVQHAGFAADGNVLQNFPGADLSQELYPVARIRIAPAVEVEAEVETDIEPEAEVEPEVETEIEE